MSVSLIWQLLIKWRVRDAGNVSGTATDGGINVCSPMAGDRRG
ncbi:hypothetical protein EC991775_3022 [Escherichia coli 99.1775]|nr:hypothetical protein EC991775_3022 [Escherichia coli 99.1775]